MLLTDCIGNIWFCSQLHFKHFFNWFHDLVFPCCFFFFYLASHVSHLENVSEEEINRLLGIALDVEYLFTCVHKEEDADTKQVYFYLFKVLNTIQGRFNVDRYGTYLMVQERWVGVMGDACIWKIKPIKQFFCFFIPLYTKLLRKCILQMGKPVVEGSLESPPFEKPSIEQVIAVIMTFFPIS